MTGLRNYGDYKASGTQWLGDVPAHWGVTRLSRGFVLMRRAPRDSDTNLTAYRDGEVTLRSNRRLDGYTEADKEIGYQGIRVGDLVIHAMDAFAGAIGVSDSDGKSSPVYLACRALPGHEAAYFARVMRHIALSGYITSLGKGVRERSTDFRWSDAKNVLVPVPPVKEQRAILKYLDRETRQIDALITKQEKLVETLTERRQAVIAQAVTRGLDPSVELKESAMPWFGQIPTHWLTPKVSLHFNVTLGKMLDVKRPAQADDILLPYIRAGNIHEDALDLEDLNEMPFSPQEVSSLALRRGDLLVVEGGAVGVNQYLEDDLPAVSFQKTVNRVRPRGEDSARFLGFVLDVIRYRGVIDMICNKSTIAHLTADKLNRIVFPQPPSDEQDEIVNHLLDETARIDGLIHKAGEVVEVLKERRQALVSAAVTGKIDVKGL